MNALQKPGESVVAQPAGRQSSIDLLPAEFREPVRFFFGFWSDTLRGTTGIATRFRWWIREEGLTLAEATEAMKRVMSPEKSAEMPKSPPSSATGRAARSNRPTANMRIGRRPAP